MSSKTKIRSYNKSVLSILFVCLLSAIVICVSSKAYADDLSDAQQTLDDASAQLNSITDEYNELQAEVTDYDTQIQQVADQVSQAQDAMQKGQEVLGQTVLASYKSDDSLSLINVFLSSEDIETFLKNLEYYTSIQESEAQIVAEQKQLTEEFNARLSELDEKKDAQEQLLNQAEAKKEEAQHVVDEASAKVSNIESERERLAQLEIQAASLDQSQTDQSESSESSEESISPNWNTNTETVASSTSSTNSASSSSSSGSNSSTGVSSSSSSSATNSSSSSSSSSSSEGWKSGLASAYGGSSDSNTPNPGTTATGSVCNDSSMGVAIPTSWSNYRSYFGRKVEIKYNGKTVVATINDCGSLGGGARSLDLQPGVFKALGFSTCQAWGIRTVEYRIL